MRRGTLYTILGFFWFLAAAMSVLAAVGNAESAGMLYGIGEDSTAATFKSLVAMNLISAAMLALVGIIMLTIVAPRAREKEDAEAETESASDPA